jgi:hypothetical protein
MEKTMVEIFIEGKIDPETGVQQLTRLHGKKIILVEGTPITVRPGENGSSYVQVPLGDNILFRLRVDRGDAYSLPIDSGKNVLIRHK